MKLPRTVLICLAVAPSLLWTNAFATPAFSYGDVPDPEPGPSYATLAKALRANWPRLADVIARGDTAVSRASDFPVVQEALRLAARAKGDPAQVDLVILSASYWSMQYWPHDSLLAQEFNRVIGAYGGRLVEAHDGYCYDEGLLDSLLGRAGSADRWADYAFLWRMYNGFQSSCKACFEGIDLFPVVIRRGERFLARHPESVIAPDVARMLGEAHETAWSLSLYVERAADEATNFFVPNPRIYAADAPTHRAKAIRLYERYLNQRPREPWSADVRRRLALLRANHDTKFYKYYCCCWD